MRVLISDSMSSKAADIFREKGVDVTVSPNLSQAELIELIPFYDGLAVRSATQVTSDIIAAASRLKVIGRAGIGTDNIDIDAATNKGVVVMNTPFGNAITTAEHSIAMIFAVARQIPSANASTHQGLWEKSRFMGIELTGKILGIIGCGNIGSIVAERALGLKMKVLAYDPFLSLERAAKLGVKKVTLEALLASANFVTLHVPKTPQTENIIDADALAQMQKGAYLINCARGGLVDEDALAKALQSGHLAGAALDVFGQEPAKENVLFGMDSVVCTPHLGAATLEAQEKVALQVAEQISDYLLEGAISNALNAPSLSAEQAKVLAPYLTLCRQLGSLAGQLTKDEMTAIDICFSGQATEVETSPLVQTAVMAALKPQLTSINMVNALTIAKERGIEVKTSICETTDQDYNSIISLEITTQSKKRALKGTLINGHMPRLIEIKGIKLESELMDHMLYVANKDRPGFIGAMGSILGKIGLNVATFHLGRTAPGEDAVSLIGIDGGIDKQSIAAIKALPMVDHVTYLRFERTIKSS